MRPINLVMISESLLSIKARGKQQEMGRFPTLITGRRWNVVACTRKEELKYIIRLKSIWRRKEKEGPPTEPAIFQRQQKELKITQHFFVVAGSILDSGGGRQASLMTSADTLQMREANLTGHKINYLDSGYSEEDANLVVDPQQQQQQQQHMATSCLMKTASGSIYIPGSELINCFSLPCCTM